MFDNYQINKNIKLATVQDLIKEEKLHYIQGLGTICSLCGEPIKLHGSRYNKKLKKYETFCPNVYILVDNNYQIITSFTPELFNLIFSKKEI